MMAAHVVPAALVRPGRPPFVKDAKHPPTCRVCDRPYPAHTGDTCAICRRPVEHHTDAEAMVDEVRAAAEMAAARAAGGATLDDVDRWCLANAERVEARAA